MLKYVFNVPENGKNNYQVRLLSGFGVTEDLTIVTPFQFCDLFVFRFEFCDLFIFFI